MQNKAWMDCVRGGGVNQASNNSVPCILNGLDTEVHVMQNQ